MNITFPDGSIKTFEAGVTAFEVAQSISPRLAAEVLAAPIKTDGEDAGTVIDLDRRIEKDCTIVFHKWEDEAGKHVFWHSSAHLLAQALQAIYPGVHFGVGPALENGFYYDVDLGDHQLTEADLKAIEDERFSSVTKYARQTP